MFMVVLLIGIVTGFFDSIVGAGGLISVPSLLFLGLPPQIAIATDRFGSLGQRCAALYQFWKTKKIVWKYVPLLSVIALGGALIGANLLLTIDPQLLETIIGILILAVLPFLFLRKDLGIKSIKPSTSKRIIGFIMYLGITIFSGFFGQGTGPMYVYVLTFFLGLTVVEVLATNIIPGMVLAVSSLILFASHDLINYTFGVILLIGMAIGGYIGSHAVLKKGDQWVKQLLVVFVIIFGIKLLLF